LRIDLIVNPRAGRRPPNLVRALREAGGALGEARVHPTTAAGEARRLASRVVEEGSQLVVAAGGDGTANEVASALVGGPTPLAILPTGSGNGLARVLEIPREPAEALRALRGGTIRAMDVGLLNGEPFLNVAGIGLDAEVGIAFQARGNGARPRGLPAYFELAFKGIATSTARGYALETDAGRIEGRALIVAFTNGRQYGGGAVIAPDALLDDGLLDVVVFEEVSLPGILAHAPKLFLGGIESFPSYRRVRTARAIVRSDVPLPLHRDGEPGGEDRLFEVGLRRAALRVVVPARTIRDPRGPFQAVPFVRAPPLW
jgi:YegS/Rv2252/BmrU family lipid kinase